MSCSRKGGTSRIKEFNQTGDRACCGCFNAFCLNLDKFCQWTASPKVAINISKAQTKGLCIATLSK